MSVATNDGVLGLLGAVEQRRVVLRLDGLLLRLADGLLGMLVRLVGGVLHVLLCGLDGVGAEVVCLALVDLCEQALEQRADVEAVEPADGGVDVVDEKAVDLLEARDHTGVDLVHVEGIRDGRRVQAVLVRTVDIGRDVAL